MNTAHADTPSPAFRAQLEWEVARACRREARFGTDRQARSRRRIRAVTIAALCVAVGTASNFASAQVRDGSRRDSMLDAARAELAIMNLRHDLARARLDTILRQVRAGVVVQREAERNEMDVRGLEAQMARLRLDMAEIQAAAQMPRNDLGAPLVGSRDFVRERIQVELADAQERLRTAEEGLADAERIRRAGVASELEPAEAQLDVARAQARMAVLAERLDLRREFVGKGASADELVKRADGAQLRQDLQVASQAVKLAKIRLDLARRQREAGSTTELEYLRAQVEMQERELELSRLAKQIGSSVRTGRPL